MSTRPSDESTAAAAADVPVSAELFAPLGNLELCYQTFGDPGDDPILLVMGLGGPMNWWDPDFCRLLALGRRGRGRFVIRYDNRDTGRSSRMPGRVTRAMLVRAFAGGHVRAPYSISDMADDAFGLMSHLGLDSADVVGISMGGMIAQTMAIEQPARVRTLTSIMSTTGKRSVGWQHPRLIPTLLASRKPGREAYAEGSLRMWELIGSPGYPLDEAATIARAEETFDRGVSASGVLRQMMAVLVQPNRGPALRRLRMPALVIHGLADRMVHVSGGRATAAAIPLAQLLLVDGMGHDLPVSLYETFVSAILDTCYRAGA
jgi:pimeloyl-ACP methyl ester carboxylesterase